MALYARNNNRVLRFEERGEQLLPGIPNEITLHLITSKLSLRDIRTLSSVSRCWQEAIRSNEVYDARVCTNSTETLIVHYHRSRENLALYSTSEKCCYKLPPIPGFHREMLETHQLIALQSKLYFLQDPLINHGLMELDLASSNKVYALDLYWQRNWEPCANMPEARSKFGCGVVDGKIYVFGGLSVSPRNSPRNFFSALNEIEPHLGAEVYDPQENKWSPIMQMTRGRCEYQVAIVGKEFILYDGWLWEDFDQQYSRGRWVGGSSVIGSKEVPSLAVYNPAKNEWRSMELIWNLRLLGSQVFGAKEKFCLFSQARIDVYDSVQKSWINRHVNSFITDGRKDSFVFERPTTVFAVNDELVVTGRGRLSPERDDIFHYRTFHCKGFDTEKKELVWQQVNCPHIMFFPLVSFIQL